MLLAPPVRAEGDFALKLQATAPAGSARIWEGRNAEFEEYIRTAEIVRFEDIPLGVTRPKRAWLTPVHPWKEMEPCAKPPKWNRQAILMKMFDNLIGNPDRNMGNLLVDDEWNLYLIDHSRAFIDTRNIPVKMERIDRPMWDRMLALDEPTLRAALGKWVDTRSIRALLARRDRMKAAIDKLVSDSSEAAVFIR